MKTIIALEELIKAERERISFERSQLAKHESGERRLSRLTFASAEAKLYESLELIEKHKAMLGELKQQDQKELEAKQRLEEAIKRKKYFEEQNMRIQNNCEKSSEQKLEAMMILDELHEEVGFEDDELFEIAQKSLELHLKEHTQLAEKLNSIKERFRLLLQTSEEENIKELELLNYRIPVLVLHFSVLLDTFKENFEEVDKDGNVSNSFHGFPKYEDWWIKELWKSHQAYFALFRWKAVIETFCKTSEQRKFWTKIFDSWIFVKKLLNDKDEVAYNYHFAFDTLIFEYAELEEELINKNLESMETIIQRITSKEDFSTVMKTHNIITPYLTYKRNRVQGKIEKKQ